MRPIDADALKRAFQDYMAKKFDYNKCASAENCETCIPGCIWRKVIDSVPTLDVQPVRRGGCEYCNGSGRVLYQETHSVKLYLNSFGDARTIEVEANRCPPFADCAMANVPARSAFIINFCPHCGADMRQEEHHE